ncbi:MAG: M48 family metallopeptidase [Verrucomicrobiota bacterium]|nr:M48 family metallopeptidase [Verrucomicrobiota bacterium]
MNIYLIIILSLITFSFILNILVEYLNLKNVNSNLPEEFLNYYDKDRYTKSQHYLKDTTLFGFFSTTFTTLITVCFILFGGFNYIDNFSRSMVSGSIVRGLFFFAILAILNTLISIPFSYYSTFVIEEKYGFNKTTPVTFLVDTLKSLILTFILGGIFLSCILWLFGTLENTAWLYCWGFTTAFQFIVMFIAPVLIMPLFNKYTPLEEGELKTAIKDYADIQKFKLEGIYKMDGSKRTSKANAFFTGFGKFKRIVLYDNLIEKHSSEEIVAILAHEIGHYRKKHIQKHFALSILSSGIMFFIMGFFIKNKGLFDAFKMEYLSIYASLCFFAFLYSPISTIISIVANFLSRKYEYEADNFAMQTIKKSEALAEGLKKLSADSLSNLTPHPIKVFMDYSHPPILKRIKEIEKYKKDKNCR